MAAAPVPVPPSPAAPSPSAGEPLDLATSVAGEEDPGASIDMAVPAAPPLAGRNVCPACGGTGMVQGMQCPTCAGTGKADAGAGG